MKALEFSRMQIHLLKVIWALMRHSLFSFKAPLTDHSIEKFVILFVLLHFESQVLIESGHAER